MKTTLRKGLSSAIALLMAFAMAFGTTPAFATEIGNEIEWVDTNYADGPVSVPYEYAGKAETKGTVSYNEGYFRQYYELEIETEGFYKFTQSGYVSMAFTFGEVAPDGKIYDCFDYEFFSSETEKCDLWYLPEGEIIMGVTLWEGGSNEYELTYIGSEIADLKYDENNFKNLLEKEDIYLYETDDGYEFWVETDYTVVFPDGKEFTAEYSMLYCEIKGDNPYGPHTAEITFMNYKCEQEVAIYNIEQLVESIELADIEDCLYKIEWYNGRYSYPDYNGEVTVKYKDGTSETFCYGYDEEYGEKSGITLFGNKTYQLHINHYDDEFIVSAGGHTYLREEITETRHLSISSNKRYLDTNNESHLQRFSYINGVIREKLINARSAEDFFGCIRHFISNLESIRAILNNYILFAKYAINVKFFNF